MKKTWRFTKKRRLYTWALGSPEQLQFAWRKRPSPESALIVAGSGRSGTTWLSRLLTADREMQLIFEPLSPEWIPEIFKLTGWSGDPSLLRSFYLPAAEDNPDWYHFLERMLTGQVRSVGTDYDRTSFFPQRYLIKLIRANLMLRYLHHNFSSPIVYVTRHPCATVLSRLELNWQADTASLLQQEALVEDYLQPWVKDIEKEQDPLGKHAVMWAVENFVARSQLANFAHLRITFEGLCLSPEETTNRIRDWASLQSPSKLNAQLIREPSRQSRSDAFYASTMDRLSSWKKHLSSEDEERILSWSRRLGITEYNADILPVERDLENTATNPDL